MAAVSMGARKALVLGGNALRKAGVANPGKDAQILLGHATGLEPHRLLAEDGSVSKNQMSHFLDLISRRASRVPLQYILGRQEFMSLEFLVDSRVLIPRPETEVLVEEALRLLEDKDDPVVFDIGTGSGAIAISMGHALPRARVYAVDLSDGALEVAKANAERHGVHVCFLQGDLLEPLQFRADLIVANLPYVRDTDLEALEPEISHEPRMALAGGDDGLQVTCRLLEKVTSRLLPGGYLLLELDPKQVKRLEKTLERQEDFDETRVVQDYSHRERVLVARRAS